MTMVLWLAAAWLALAVLGWSWLATAARADREAKERQRVHGDTAPGRSANTSGNGAISVLSRESAAGKTGASGRTVQTAKRVKDVDPELAEKVLQGEVKVGTAEKQLIAEGKIASVTKAPTKTTPKPGRHSPARSAPRRVRARPRHPGIPPTPRVRATRRAK